MFSILLAMLKNIPFLVSLVNPQTGIFRTESDLTPLINTLFGAMLMGIAGAIVVRAGASTGGTEVISIMLNRKYSFPVGSLSLSLNLAVVLVLWFVSDSIKAALSVIALFISTLSFNSMQQGMNRTKTLFIISEHWDAIAPQVLDEVHRGVTLIPCRGAFTGRDKTMVYILARTVELARIRKIVRLHDPAAILSIVDTREVLGRGFTALDE
jgi:uncharacterized membrane-anchored protein YitT (DUF2179 family)